MTTPAAPADPPDQPVRGPHPPPGQRAAFDDQSPDQIPPLGLPSGGDQTAGTRYARSRRGAAGFRVRVECGGDSAASTTRCPLRLRLVTSGPRSNRGSTSTDRRFALPSKAGRFCAMGAINMVGRKVRPDVVSPGNWGFHGAYGRRVMPPLRVSAQLRSGRQGREADGENSPPPQLLAATDGCRCRRR